ncbi:hypothetical protein [Psychromicrobium sp. YIM B11713]|uniref:hypothetical protein n=1 Tax=Psychromicrobium sp. YIM B11713 TaxID=3145233 RepID=UPI00374E6CA2
MPSLSSIIDPSGNLGFRRGLRLRLLGLSDQAETGFFIRALEREGLGTGLDELTIRQLGFFVCRADLEEELIRSLAPTGVEKLIAQQGDSRSWKILQNQPAQRERSVHEQLHRFMGTTSGRKEHYARVMAEALELNELPKPLKELLQAI